MRSPRVEVGRKAKLVIVVAMSDIPVFKKAGTQSPSPVIGSCETERAHRSSALDFDRVLFWCHFEPMIAEQECQSWQLCQVSVTALKLVLEKASFFVLKVS